MSQCIIQNEIMYERARNSEFEKLINYIELIKKTIRNKEKV